MIDNLVQACEAMTNIGVAKTVQDIGGIRVASNESANTKDYTHRHGDNYLTYYAQRAGLRPMKATIFDLGILIVCDHRCCSSACLTSMLSSHLASSVSKNNLHLALATQLPMIVLCVDF